MVLVFDFNLQFNYVQWNFIRRCQLATLKYNFFGAEYVINVPFCPINNVHHCQMFTSQFIFGEQ